jgi:3-methyladenine DNA glycosylase AlkD
MLALYTAAMVARAGAGALPDRVRRALEAAAEPARAPGMQAYMKSAMPYLGVAAVPLRAACKRAFIDDDFATAARWRQGLLALWRGARHREERYAALQLAGDRRAAAHQTLEALPIYEEMIVTGAWWDYVDDIASHRLGGLLRRAPGPMKRTMLAWSRDPDMWKRRSAILCQLTFKAETDVALLYRCIEPSIGSSEFFLRKAIGWALRQHARTDPAEVARYVAAHRDQLSGLSVREALKHIGEPIRKPAAARSKVRA